MYKHGWRERPWAYPSGKAGGVRWFVISAVREAGGFLGDEAEELHGLYAQGEALAILALVHVEVGEFLYAVEAVADGVAGGGEGGGGLSGGGGVFGGGDPGGGGVPAAAGGVSGNPGVKVCGEGIGFLWVP